MIEYVNELSFANQLFILANLVRGLDEYNYTKGLPGTLLNAVTREGYNININFNNNIFQVTINDKVFNFTIDNYKKVCINIYDYLNNKYPLGIDFKNIDPVYLSLFLWKKLDSIDSICYDDVYLDDLYLPSNGNLIRLTETDVYKTLLGYNVNIIKKFNSNHVSQSSQQRVFDMLNSIKKNGYGFNHQFVILYNDENVIRDGQHRACCMRFLYGNIKIKVMRIMLNKEKEKVLKKCDMRI